ncbi:MAG: hypothetical protein SGPRY_001574 [Prymnesium sp.]
MHLPDSDQLRLSSDPRFIALLAEEREALQLQSRLREELRQKAFEIVSPPWQMKEGHVCTGSQWSGCLKGKAFYLLVALRSGEWVEAVSVRPDVSATRIEGVAREQDGVLSLELTEVEVLLGKSCKHMCTMQLKLSVGEDGIKLIGSLTVPAARARCPLELNFRGITAPGSAEIGPRMEAADHKSNPDKENAGNVAIVNEKLRYDADGKLSEEKPSFDEKDVRMGATRSPPDCSDSNPQSTAHQQGEFAYNDETDDAPHEIVDFSDSHAQPSRTTGQRQMALVEIDEAEDALLSTTTCSDVYEQPVHRTHGETPKAELWNSAAMRPEPTHVNATLSDTQSEMGSHAEAEAADVGAPDERRVTSSSPTSPSQGWKAIQRHEEGQMTLTTTQDMAAHATKSMPTPHASRELGTSIFQRLAERRK